LATLTVDGWPGTSEEIANRVALRLAEAGLTPEARRGQPGG
jgi:hypothetical protein